MGQATDPYVREIESWRSARLASLTGPTGWLTLVGLSWLKDGENTIGSDPANAVVLPEGKSPPDLGTIEVEDGRVVARFDPDWGVTHDGAPVASLALKDDRGSSPTILELGSLSFYVIEREGERAIRVKDSESPARRGFNGIDHYPVNRRWQVRARFEAKDPPLQVGVMTVLGREETYLVPGGLAFELDRSPYRLDVFLEDGESDLFVVFGDLTNADSTFGGGRYVYTRPPDADGLVVLDFNKAYNPPCVFTPYATCPLPLQQNRLQVRIEAGEKRYLGAATHA